MNGADAVEGLEESFRSRIRTYGRSEIGFMIYKRIEKEESESVKDVRERGGSLRKGRN